MSHSYKIIPERNEPITLQYGGFAWAYDADSADFPSYPTPKVTWNIDKQRDSAGKLLSEEITVDIQGVVSRHALFETANELEKTTFGVLMQDAENLRDKIIENDNEFLLFEFVGTPMVSGNASIQNFSFSPNENYWTTAIDYSLSLRISNTGIGETVLGKTLHFHITDSSHAISIDKDDRTFIHSDNSVHHLYRITRNASASAKAYGDSTRGALSFAKGWVMKIAGDLTNFVDSNWNLYNKTSSVDFSETDGRYSVQESYILKSGDPWIHNEQINISTNRDNDLRTLTLEGEVEGLELALGTFAVHSGLTHHSGRLDISGIAPQLSYTKGDKYQFKPLEETEEGEEEEAEDTAEAYTKYDNAVSGYATIYDNTFERALSFDSIAKDLNTFISARPIHAIPVSTDEGMSPQQGKISYSVTYDSRPTGLLPDSIFETLSYSDRKPQSLITTVPVIGRRLGPLYFNPQGYSNVSEGKFASGVGTRTITYEGFFPPITGLKNYEFPIEIVNKIDDYLYRYAPGGRYTGFVKDDNQELNLTDNKVMKSITWEYIECNP